MENESMMAEDDWRPIYHKIKNQILEQIDKNEDEITLSMDAKEFLSFKRIPLWALKDVSAGVSDDVEIILMVQGDYDDHS